jgi:hypothetical protein
LEVLISFLRFRATAGLSRPQDFAGPFLHPPALNFPFTYNQIKSKP